MADDYTYWRETLAGKRVPMYEDDPRPGWYRFRRTKNSAWTPLVIWRASDGIIYARTWGVYSVDPVSVWMQAARFPISVDEHTDLVNGKDEPAVDINSTEPVI